MPYAITLLLDTEAAALVVAMWEALAARGVSADALQLGYPPHVTLAVFPDSADLERLLRATREYATQWHRLPFELVSLGLFPGIPATLFLAPVVTPALLERHAGLLRCVATERVDPHYEVGHWVPHVTLAGGLANPPAAVAAVDPSRLPINCTLDRLEVVRFRPIAILASHRLIAA